MYVPGITKGPHKEIVRSETARFATRYVAEFLKHLRGSFMNASSTFRYTPERNQIIKTMLYEMRHDNLIDFKFHTVYVNLMYK